jgi:hypothetical protein
MKVLDAEEQLPGATDRANLHTKRRLALRALITLLVEPPLELCIDTKCFTQTH